MPEEKNTKKTAQDIIGPEQTDSRADFRIGGSPDPGASPGENLESKRPGPAAPPEQSGPDNSRAGEAGSAPPGPSGYPPLNEGPEAWEGKTVISSENTKGTTVSQARRAREAPPSLLLLAGPDDLIGFSWPLLKEKTSVGRSRSLSDISISCSKLSKAHFQIIKESEKFYIADLDSTNKTLVNEKLLEPYKKASLDPGSLIQASQLIFKFLPAGSLEIAAARQTLNKAQTDPLTGAGNRQSLKIKALEYFHSRDSLSLIVFDIDDFKPINDEMGHLAGDYVLREMSKIIMDMIREGDMFFRYGGDEFCLLTPNDEKEAKKIARRIQNSVESRGFSFKGKSFNARISTGVSERRPEDKKWEEIYYRADQLSYQAKRLRKARGKEAGGGQAPRGGGA